MEYVVLRAARPTWLNTQLPADAAELIRFGAADPREPPDLLRGIAFFARGPGIVRVVSAHQAREVVFAEQSRHRSLGFARVSEKFLFNIPAAIQRHLGLHAEPRGDQGIRSTDDSILWLVPAPEYYEFRSYERRDRPWTGPTGGGFAHLYLTKAILPLDASLESLTDAERRIEADEWRPMIDAMHRVGRARKAPAA